MKLPVVDPFETSLQGFRFWRKHELYKNALRKWAPKIAAKREPKWAARAARKAQRQTPQDETIEDFNRVEQELPAMDKLLEILAKYRTSSKSGASGIIVPWLTAAAVVLPFYEPLSAYVAEACAQPKPLDFLLAGAAAWAVTWVSMFVAARRSKTPAIVGKL